MGFSMGGPHHRAWNWFDEQGWNRTLKLPLGVPTKYGSNPVISVGGGGAWDDTRCQHPCALKYNGKYYVYYTGYSGANFGIGLAYGTSPTSLTKSASNPFFVGTLNPADWNYWVYTPSVIYDDNDDTWKMWYVGETQAGVRTLGYATASDPEGAWAQDAGNPIWNDGGNFHGGSTALRLGNMFYMAYLRTDNKMYAAYSTDENSAWTNYSQILDVGGGGAWDSNAVGYPSIFWNSGVWYLLYTGLNAGGVYKCGIAQASIGWENVFYKSPFNPIITVGAGATWEEKSVAQPALVPEEGMFHVYYQGWNNANTFQIGYATIP